MKQKQNRYGEIDRVR